MGLLYRARDLQAVSASDSKSEIQREQVKPDVFVHVLPADFASSIAMASQLQQQNRKLREAGLPHILTVREFGRDREKVFAVLDHPDARLHVLDSQQMNSEHGLVPQITEGLSCLHRYDLMHGGLEAQVFLVSDQGKVYLWGTGVMPVMCRNQSGLCMEDSPYLSPERYLGVEPRRRDDIYALGVQLYHWKTGRWPYQSANAVRARENGENPIPVSECAEFSESGEFSDEQWALLKSALSLDSSQRPAQIADLAPVFDPVKQQRTLPWWQWGLAAGIILAVSGGLYSFIQSDVRSTFAEQSPRQVVIPVVAPVLPEPIAVPAPVEEQPIQPTPPSAANTSDTAEVPKTEQAQADLTPVDVTPEVVSEPIPEPVPEPVKIYLEDAPVEDATETTIADTPAAPEEKVETPAAEPAVVVATQQTQRTVSEALPEPSQQVSEQTEPEALPESGIAWSEQQRPAAALASLEQELIYGGESVYPPFGSSRPAEQARSQPQNRQASASNSSNSSNATNASSVRGRAGRDLRGIPLSRWTAQELSLRANQALRSGRLDEEANRGAVYFIRHLKRFHRGHPDIKRLAGGVVSGLHKRAQAQLAQKQKLQMGRTLFFAKKFIREFNLVGYNAVQEKLEHEQDDLPRRR